MISNAKNFLISSQSSKNIISVVQDSQLGAHRMTSTLHGKKLSQAQFFDICSGFPISPLDPDFDPEIPEAMMSTNYILERIQHTRRVLKSLGKKVQCYNGKGLVSVMLPLDFNYEKKNDADKNEPVVKIHRGVLYEGALDKNIVGSAYNSIIQILNKEYSADAACHFIDCLTFATNHYLSINTFTIGPDDCMISKQVNENGVSKQEEIQDVIKKCYVEAESMKQTVSHPGIREVKITGALNKAKDIGLKIAKEALAPTNAFVSTITAGSKGDFFNIAQITGLLGQQNLKDKRVPLAMNHGRRSLPHYPFEITEPEMEYESRGFVASSFMGGLNPREFYFHAMTGRESICQTAMGTATSGYMQRRIVKLNEDIKIQYDGTVRDTLGKMYQVAYADDGFDPMKTVKVGSEQEPCDVSRLIDRLNTQYEASQE